jgi:hypothetical protein
MWEGSDLFCDTKQLSSFPLWEALLNLLCIFHYLHCEANIYPDF